MNLKRVVAIIICVGLFFLLRSGLTIYFLASALRELDNPKNMTVKDHQPMLAFGEGYYYSDHFPEKMSNPPQFGKLLLITETPYDSSKPATLEDVIKEVKNHLPRNHVDFQAKLPQIIVNELNELDTSIPEFELPGYEGAIPQYREYRYTSRFWADIGRLMLYEGQENSAFAISAGILLLAHKLERDPESGSLLLTRLIGMTVRNIGNGLLLEHANKTKLSANELKLWISRYQKLRKAVLPLYDSCKAEARFYEVAGNFLKSKGFYSGKMLLNNKKAFEKINEKIIYKYIESDNLPYSEKIEIFREVDDYLYGLHDLQKVSYSSILDAIISPSNLVAKLFAAYFTPNFRKSYETLAKTLQCADGALTTLIIKAYMAEKNDLPDSLAQLEGWYGEKLPGDIFADMAPMHYSKTGPKRLFSIGPDMEPDTDDDLVFYPLKAN